MARTTATKSSRLKQKPEAEIDTAIRKLIKCLLEFNLNANKEFKNVDLNNNARGEIVSLVTENFGEAIFTLVDSAVVQEISLSIDDEDPDDQGDRTDDYSRL
jgi:hypothetical protein